MRAFAKLFERPVSNLPNPLTRHAEQRPDLFQGPLLAIVQPVIQVEDLSLALGQVALEHRLEELATRDGFDVLFDVRGGRTREALAEAGAVTVTAVDGGIEAELGGGDPAQGPDRVHGLVHLPCDLDVSRLTAEHLGQRSVRPGQLGQVRVLVERDSDGPGLLGKRLEHGLPNPPDGIGNEFHTLVGIEFLDRLEKALVADADELGKSESTTLVLLHVGDDEAEVGRYESLGRLLVTFSCSTSEFSLFPGILDEGVLLDVLQVLVERIQATRGRKHSFLPFLDLRVEKD